MFRAYGSRSIHNFLQRVETHCYKMFRAYGSALIGACQENHNRYKESNLYIQFANATRKFEEA